MNSNTTRSVRLLALNLLLAAGLALSLVPAAVTESADPLPSWKEGAAKRAVTGFVARVTREGGEDFVPPAERIATFDQEGTLGSGQPVDFQLAFALDRVRALAPRHPEWRTRQPFKAALDNDLETLAAMGEEGFAQLILATHAGMTTDELGKTVSDWLATAREPRSRRPYTELVYQPMLELLAFLRANGFKIYVVSEGTVEFMRVFAERAYGIPPEQVVGAAFVTRFQRAADGKARLVCQPEIEFVGDGPGKPETLHKLLGRRPILAFGGPDGDRQMLEWTAAGGGPRFLGLVHPTGAGRPDEALDEAAARGWVVVDMKRSWNVIYPPGR
ncbi:MAG TPA: HAD family hydrolase [Thermoanaerobaculia bacterium]